MNLREWANANAAGFSGELKFDEPLLRHAYYRIGGPATLLALPRGIDDLRWLARAASETGAERFVLGLGSNVLVSDEGFDGIVVKTGRIDLGIAVAPSGALRTGASVAASSLLRRASQEGWGGLEFLTGVPGSIGGAIYMNAGTHLGEAKDRVTAVEALLADGTLKRYESNELRFEYRRNLFLPEQAIVTAAEWRIDIEDASAVKARIDEVLARRKASQPVEFPSCGSVFKNPREHGLHAWQVIERLGLRGHQIGDAQFSEKHPNFIVNLGSARAADVRSLIELAKSRAMAELGIELHEEVKYVGRFHSAL